MSDLDKSCIQGPISSPTASHCGGKWHVKAWPVLGTIGARNTSIIAGFEAQESRLLSFKSTSIIQNPAESLSEVLLPASNHHGGPVVPTSSHHGGPFVATVPLLSTVAQWHYPLTTVAQLYQPLMIRRPTGWLQERHLCCSLSLFLFNLKQIL